MSNTTEVVERMTLQMQIAALNEKAMDAETLQIKLDTVYNALPVGFAREAFIEVVKDYKNSLQLISALSQMNMSLNSELSRRRANRPSQEQST